MSESSEQIRDEKLTGYQGAKMADLAVLANPSGQFQVSVDGSEFMNETPEQLYRESEALFFELLKASNLLSGDAASPQDDYVTRFHYLFFRFINGQLKPEELENPDSQARETRAKHIQMIQNPYVGRLYDHCQTRIIAYMLKMGVIASEDEYVSKNYSDIFQVLSTGLLRVRPRERLLADLSQSPQSQPPVDFADATVTPTYTVNTEVAIALAS